MVTDISISLPLKRHRPDRCRLLLRWKQTTLPLYHPRNAHRHSRLRDRPRLNLLRPCGCPLLRMLPHHD